MLPRVEVSNTDVSHTSTPRAPSQLPSTDGRPVAEPLLPPPPQYQGSPRWRQWLRRLAIVLVFLVAVGIARWYWLRPPEVTLIQPTVIPITEMIASSGRVRGVTETVVGAQASGIVERLFVDEGARVTSGQALAILNRDVAEARLAQAQQAFQTARAQLAQIERGPLPSEVETAREQVRQAQAQMAQQRAAAKQAQQAVAQAIAQLRQLQAEMNLSATQLERSAALYERNYISRDDYDQARTQYRVAEQRVTAAEQAVEVAQATVQAAQAGVRAAEANVKALEARLRTVQSGATPEEIEVARQRAAEAERGLRVARQQVEEAVVTAPFDGIITAINAELGQPVGTQGVVRLVSSALEIRLDVDENNLADLALGEEAMISSSAFPNQTFRGTVSDIGAAVDQMRGTVTVRVRPEQPPSWLRPGQTVNVNIITHRAVPRLLVPPAAVRRSGDQTVVFVVNNGQALEKVVLTRPPTPQGVPILAGLEPEDRIVAEAQSITAGGSVRVRE